MASESLRVLDIDASEISDHADLIRCITDQEVTIALVRGVFPAAAAAEVVARVEAGEGASRLTEVAPQFRIYSLGLALDTAESLEQYLGEASLFVPECRSIFRGLFDYLDWVPQLLSRFCGGRSLEIPAQDGRFYNPVTIRRLPAGGLIPPHCETEQLNRPAYTHLKALIGSSPIISYYTTLRPPQEGGEVRVSKMAWGDVAISADGRSNAAAVIDRFESEIFLPNIGDLILFDGGRQYHQVLAVGGERPRWTIGGFLCESAGRDKVWYWS
jgi:hypothetical protein